MAFCLINRLTCTAQKHCNALIERSPFNCFSVATMKSTYDAGILFTYKQVRLSGALHLQLFFDVVCDRLRCIASGICIKRFAYATCTLDEYAIVLKSKLTAIELNCF